ncbi:hypothetical protein ACO0QE_001097 [Hanseniaspora vineae]
MVAGFEVSNIESGRFLDHNYCVERNGDFLPVEYFATKITAKRINDNVASPLLQHTAKRIQGNLISSQIQAVIPSALPSPQVLRETSNIKKSAKLKKYASEFYLDKESLAELLMSSDSIPEKKLQKAARYDRIQFGCLLKNSGRATQFNNFFSLVSILGVVIKGNVVSLIAKKKDDFVQPVYMEQINCTFVPVHSKETPPLMILGRSPSSYDSEKLEILKQKLQKKPELVNSLESTLNKKIKTATPCINKEFDAASAGQNGLEETFPVRNLERTPSLGDLETSQAFKQKRKKVSEMDERVEKQTSELLGTIKKGNLQDLNTETAVPKKLIVTKKVKRKAPKHQQENPYFSRKLKKRKAKPKKMSLDKFQQEPPILKKYETKMLSSVQQRLQCIKASELNNQSLCSLLEKNDQPSQMEASKNNGKIEQTDSENDLSLMKDESFLENKSETETPKEITSNYWDPSLPICAPLNINTKKFFFRKTRRAERDFYQNMFANDGYIKKPTFLKKTDGTMSVTSDHRSGVSNFSRSINNEHIPIFSGNSVSSSGSRNLKQNLGDTFNGINFSVGEITQDSFTSPVKKSDKVQKSVFEVDEERSEIEHCEEKFLEWNEFGKIEASPFVNRYTPFSLMNESSKLCKKSKQGSSVSRTTLYKGTNVLANNFGINLENQNFQERHYGYKKREFESNWNSMQTYKEFFDASCVLPVSSSYSGASTRMTRFSSSRPYNNIRFESMPNMLGAFRINKGALGSATSYKSSNIASIAEKENMEANETA